MLPSKISATNVELLIRNPYGFYAKNILGLRPLDNIFTNKILSKFGNFIHKIIEEYTKNYENAKDDKYGYILYIGQKIAKEDFKGDSQVNLWWPKFQAISREFVDFDSERRMACLKVMPEIYGEMVLTIGNREIIVSAIADRIDQTSNGKVHILDYKTGILPSKIDIMNGLSVQMIIEALIVDSNGFKEIHGEIEEIIYVKIASSTPYITTIKIPIDEIDLEAHKRGLIKILSYYDSCNEFRVNDNIKFAPPYDDYKHLARKEI
ncbi:MAG UNVERIFIED_CONTAM: PD-(D/E)XK nuclease family protein [Rickettsiaceae bacterium]|jgi:ATP-dependent helicase/nuclease subunit B